MQVCAWAARITVLAALLAAPVLACAPRAAREVPAEGPGRGPHNVGYRVLELRPDDWPEAKSVTVAVWYPTAAKPRNHTYGGPTQGMVAVDAAPLAGHGRFPFLVFSHGYGGSGLGAVFLTEYLAARGWVVAAPDHNDSHSAVRVRHGQLDDFDSRALFREAERIAASGPEQRGEYDYRLDETQLVLERVPESEEFQDVVDTERTAVGGHSFGGFTALGVAGTVPQRHDPRVKALLLFSTGAGGYLFTEAELGAVDVPSMLLVGEREQEQARGDSTMGELSVKIYSSLSAPKYLLEVAGAGHFSFNARFSDRPGARRLSGTPAEFATIRAYAVDFLEAYVTDDEEALRRLQRRVRDDEGLSRSRKAP